MERGTACLLVMLYNSSYKVAIYFLFLILFATERLNKGIGKHHKGILYIQRALQFCMVF